MNKRVTTEVFSLLLLNVKGYCRSFRAQTKHVIVISSPRAGGLSTRRRETENPGASNASPGVNTPRAVEQPVGELGGGLTHPARRKPIVLGKR